MVGTQTSTYVHAQQRMTVPGAYGRVVAGDSSSLWFEDQDGTLRQVTIPAGNTVLAIFRTAR